MRHLAWIALSVVAACAPSRNGNGGGDDGGSGSATCPVCSPDKSAVIDCDGNATACNPDETCADGVCMNGCLAADTNHESVGCDYYSVDMDAASGPPQDACYTVFVANTSRGRVHINAEWNGQTIDLAQFAKLPTGEGQSLTYAPYDPVAGLAPSEVAILFLAYAPPAIPLMPNVDCPVPAAIGTEAADQRHRPGPGVPHHDRPAGRRVPDAAVRRRSRRGHGRVAAAARRARGATTTSRSRRTTPTGRRSWSRWARRSTSSRWTTTRTSRCGRSRRSPRAAG